MVTNLRDMEVKEIFPGYKGKLIHSERMTVAHWKIDEGAPVPEHDHPHEQIVNVMAGRYELVIDGTPHVLEPGAIVIIPPHVTHSGRALTDCELIDVWSPPREDYASA